MEISRTIVFFVKLAREVDIGDDKLARLLEVVSDEKQEPSEKVGYILGICKNCAGHSLNAYGISRVVTLGMFQREDGARMFLSKLGFDKKIWDINDVCLHHGYILGVLEGFSFLNEHAPESAVNLEKDVMKVLEHLVFEKQLDGVKMMDATGGNLSNIVTELVRVNLTFSRKFLSLAWTKYAGRFTPCATQMVDEFNHKIFNRLSAEERARALSEYLEKEATA